MDKRGFLKLAGLGLASMSLPLSGSVLAASKAQAKTSSLDGLTDITGSVAPISAAERRQRIAKAQQLMQQYDIAALVLEPGAAMDYFSGIQWWRSERLTALVIPREGEVAVVCPFFEEPSIRETLQVGSDVRVWQEHESPFQRVVQVLKDRGINNGRIGFESSVRYFVVDGIMAIANNMTHTLAEPVTLGCRMYKTQHELQLMHKASEVTLRAYEFVFNNLEKGMTQAHAKQLMNQAQVALGGSSPWCLALFNEASAYPHGTHQQQTIKDGSIVLLDSGCAVHGYQSDISRTLVYGSASKHQRKVWETVRNGQDIAFNAAKLGKPAGTVDDAVRAYYETMGYGPDYQLPGLSHRTGHGIGMEGHERVNFVHNEATPLKPGMCFSNEPGIYIPGQFGVRLEDCLYMTESGPKWFTEPPTSLDSPLGKLAAKP
ncbi:peptidase [Idiomarina tyrosinivorans]|uniref:Peptidase n=1 Tax=Idiomarina tyrosinivorans TaxID=1445662 RepID=A0A432ZSD2_9GAMM|nr:Xaa-Pro peptidase family protein [Idiomarina tyrosinivorans]RUO80799.1 peptidase [Idiomarina tyrosinivorans]